MKGRSRTPFPEIPSASPILKRPAEFTLLHYPRQRRLQMLRLGGHDRGGGWSGCLTANVQKAESGDRRVGT